MKKAEEGVERSSGPQAWRPTESLRREIDRIIDDFDRGFGPEPGSLELTSISDCHRVALILELVLVKQAFEAAMEQSPKVLVIYFTRSGNTEQLAQALAAALGGNCERIRERDDRSLRIGPFGYLRSLRDALTHRPATILSALHDVSSYDVIAIGTPVWAGRASTPVSTWLRLNREQLKQVAFFCSMGARGSKTTFDEMQELSGKVPLATCAISARDISRGADREPLDIFAQEIRDAAATSDSARFIA